MTYAVSQKEEKEVSRKPWHQFKISLYKIKGAYSRVEFPGNPQTGGTAGVKVHNYILKLGLSLKISASSPEETSVYEVYKEDLPGVNPDRIRLGLRNLHAKFARAGAELVEIDDTEYQIQDTNETNPEDSPVNRREFEALKKQFAIAKIADQESEQELKFLEAKLRDLKNLNS